MIDAIIFFGVFCIALRWMIKKSDELEKQSKK